ncbi:MAG: hypothetical protein P8183_07230 [Anaerolineae bacterium]
MKVRRWAGFVGLGALLLLAGLACGRTVATAVSTPSQAALTQIVQDRDFQLTLPDWPSAAHPDENTLTAVSQNGQTIALARHELTPRIVGRYFLANLPDLGDFHDLELAESVDQVVINGRIGGPIEQQVRFMFAYCGGYTYQLTGSAPAAAFDDFVPLLEQVAAGAVCAHQPQMAPDENGLVGLIINPAHGDYDFANWRTAVAEARAAGVQATHSYLSWSDIEKSPGQYDWSLADYLLDVMTLEGLRLSLVIDLIHTSVPGQTPPDLAGKSFADPAYVERAAALAAAVAQRYGDQLDYLALGNEVNIYLADHPEDVEPYLALLETMRTAVHEVGQCWTR